MAGDEREDEADYVEESADAIRDLRDRKLTPDEYEELKRWLSDEVVLEKLLYSECSYLVLGSYGTEARNQAEKKRLERVRDVLADRSPNHHAFLLEDLPDFHLNWVIQFVVAAQRVDYVVGVFEHNIGGHELEAGVLTLLQSHDLWVLKREYETEEREREHFDGMMADFFELVADRDELRRWTDEEELVRLATEEIPGEDVT